MSIMPFAYEINESLIKSRYARFAKGIITEEEIQTYWKDPSHPLFEYQFFKKNSEGETKAIKFSLIGVNAQIAKALVDNTANAWSFDEDVAALRLKLECFLEHRANHKPCLFTREFYAVVDEKNQPFAVVGMSTNDIINGNGFACRGKLEKNHYLPIGLSIIVVAKQYQGLGIGGFLFDWWENFARYRGADILYLHTSEVDKSALALYEKRGFKMDFSVPNYFGNNRNLEIYAASVKSDVKNTSPPDEQISHSNQNEILNLAKKIYSKERFEEFVVCLELILSQQTQHSLSTPITFVKRGKDNKIESFAILGKRNYKNMLMCFWKGCIPDPKALEDLLEAIKAVAQKNDREVLIFYSEGEDPALVPLGFKRVGKEGISNVFDKGDPDRYFFYTKPVK